jgi:S-formylglutathione hydrolase FrmB
VSQAPKDTFVAGLSMGGYGAMLSALRQPGRFGAAASLSGALDLARRQSVDELGVLEHVFERSAAGGEADLFALLDRAEPDQTPPLYVRCGTQDGLVEDSRRFVARAQSRGIDVTSRFDPGEHEWGYWDRAIQDVLAWLPIRTRPLAG